MNEMLTVITYNVKVACVQKAQELISQLAQTELGSLHRYCMRVWQIPIDEGAPAVELQFSTTLTLPQVRQLLKSASMVIVDSTLVQQDVYYVHKKKKQ